MAATYDLSRLSTEQMQVCKQALREYVERERVKLSDAEFRGEAARIVERIQAAESLEKEIVGQLVQPKFLQDVARNGL